MAASTDETIRTAVDVLARLSPRGSAPESLLQEARFLEGDPERLAAAADGFGLVVAGCTAASAVVLGHPAFVVAAVGAGLGTTAWLRGGLQVLASARRTRALGTAPTVVSRAVLRMRVAATAEGAAAFAAETEGRLGADLAEHVRRARGTPRSGLDRFAAEWREQFPALHRSLTLVTAAAAAPADERDRALDRAMDAVLEGTRDRAADAANSLHGPATAVYAFGVLLPLALVGIVPAAGAAGVDLTLPTIVAVYDVVLPFGLLCAAGWLLANRPVAFPPANVGDRHRPDRRWSSVVAGAAAGVSAAVVATAVLPRWTGPLAAAGAGTGVALVVQYRPVVAVRRRADALEESLPDALYLVGRRVADGVAVERAVIEATDELDGVVGEVFETAASRQRQLRIDVETAFTGEYGALEGVPSRRAVSTARLLGVAARAGPPAGRALLETADHLDALRRVEQEARRDLSRVTATLTNTAAVFGPLVGGTTVALADGVGRSGALDGAAPPTAGLGVAVGVYVLLLAAVLTALSTGLARGFDRATVGYRVGVALVSATATYLVAFLAAATVAGGL